MDSDDEVRDRALLYLEILKQKQKALASHYILSGECHVILQYKSCDRRVLSCESHMTSISVDLSVSVVGLERSLMQYCNQPQDTPFDMKTVPIETAPLGATKCEVLKIFG